MAENLRLSMGPSPAGAPSTGATAGTGATSATGATAGTGASAAMRATPAGAAVRASAAGAARTTATAKASCSRLQVSGAIRNRCHNDCLLACLHHAPSHHEALRLGIEAERNALGFGMVSFVAGTWMLELASHHLRSIRP